MFVFPLSFFYYFLYYTDTLSTFSLLLCYWVSTATLTHHSTEKNKVTGTGTGSMLFSFLLQVLLLAAASLTILARQTNAVWVLFIAGTAMLHILQEDKHFRFVS